MTLPIIAGTDILNMNSYTTKRDKEEGTRRVSLFETRKKMRGGEEGWQQRQGEKQRRSKEGTWKKKQ